MGEADVSVGCRSDMSLWHPESCKSLRSTNWAPAAMLTAEFPCRASEDNRVPTYVSLLLVLGGSRNPSKPHKGKWQ